MCPMRNQRAKHSRFTMSVKQASITFHMSRARIHRLITEKKIEALTCSNGSIYIDPDQLQNYLKARILPGYCTVNDALLRLKNRKITKGGIYHYIRNDLVPYYRDGGEVFIDFEAFRVCIRDTEFACEHCGATLDEDDLRYRRTTCRACRKGEKSRPKRRREKQEKDPGTSSDAALLYDFEYRTVLMRVYLEYVENGRAGHLSYAPTGTVNHEVAMRAYRNRHIIPIVCEGKHIGWKPSFWGIKELMRFHHVEKTVNEKFRLARSVLATSIVTIPDLAEIREDYTSEPYPEEVIDRQDTVRFWKSEARCDAVDRGGLFSIPHKVGNAASRH